LQEVLDGVIIGEDGVREVDQIVVERRAGAEDVGCSAQRFYPGEEGEGEGRGREGGMEMLEGRVQK